MRFNLKNHIWTKIGGTQWKCAACGVIKEQRVPPRTQKYFNEKPIVVYFDSGVELNFKPDCKP